MDATAIDSFGPTAIATMSYVNSSLVTPYNPSSHDCSMYYIIHSLIALYHPHTLLSYVGLMMRQEVDMLVGLICFVLSLIWAIITLLNHNC